MQIMAEKEFIMDLDAHIGSNRIEEEMTQHTTTGNQRLAEKKQTGLTLSEQKKLGIIDIEIGTPLCLPVKGHEIC